MLCICHMRPWFNVSDPETENALYGMKSIRRFSRIELTEDATPDETTILNFRHLYSLEKHKLTEQILAQMRQLLEEKKPLLKAGTTVNATMISTSASTKSARGKRGPNMP